MIGQINGLPDLDTLTYLDGFLYAADSLRGFDADLYKIDPDTGLAINLGKTGVTGLNGLAAMPSEIPAPASMLLLASAAIGLGIWGRMRSY